MDLDARDAAGPARQLTPPPLPVPALPLGAPLPPSRPLAPRGRRWMMPLIITAGVLVLVVADGATFLSERSPQARRAAAASTEQKYLDAAEAYGADPAGAAASTAVADKDLITDPQTLAAIKALFT